MTVNLLSYPQRKFVIVFYRFNHAQKVEFLDGDGGAAETRTPTLRQ
jgi:hypothetical protein